ncbi:MAG: 5'-nucleotidase C-terminal domain-containing protein [Christensenellales bacterium]
MKAASSPPRASRWRAPTTCCSRWKSACRRGLDTPAGHLDPPLVAEDHLKAALNGSNLANFINTVQLEASGAQIASSALPNEFKGLPTEVTIRDVVSTYIYTNTLVVLEMTRPALKQYIERSAAYFDHDEDGNSSASRTNSSARRCSITITISSPASITPSTRATPSASA